MLRAIKFFILALFVFAFCSCKNTDTPAEPKQSEPVPAMKGKISNWQWSDSLSICMSCVNSSGDTLFYNKAKINSDGIFEMPLNPPPIECFYKISGPNLVISDTTARFITIFEHLPIITRDSRIFRYAVNHPYTGADTSMDHNYFTFWFYANKPVTIQGTKTQGATTTMNYSLNLPMGWSIVTQKAIPSNGVQLIEWYNDPYPDKSEWTADILFIW